MPTYPASLEVSEVSRAMFGLGWQELLIVLALVLVIFGAGKLPKVGKNLGAGIRNFKDGLKTGEGDEDDEPQKAIEKKKEPKTLEKQDEKEKQPAEKS